MLYKKKIVPGYLFKTGHRAEVKWSKARNISKSTLRYLLSYREALVDFLHIYIVSKSHENPERKPFKDEKTKNQRG